MPQLRAVPPLLAALILAGCGISEDRFATRSAEARCEFYADCGTLESYGDTLDACKAQVEALTKDSLNAEDCDYDAQAARQCLQDIKEASCDAEDNDEGDVACDDVCGESTGGDQ